MEEKKSITVSLGTVVCLFIIFVLIGVICGMWYYYNHIQENNIKQDELTGNNMVNTEVETGKNNQLNNEEENKDNKKDISKNIIMYRDMDIANAKPGIYRHGGNIYEKVPDYYNTTYDIYENGTMQGQTKGTIVETSDMEGNKCYNIRYDQKDYESSKYCIFVSCNYDVVPRNYENIKDIPSYVKSEYYNSTSLKMQSIDLDGDGKEEYVVAYSYDNKAGVDLYDSNYSKISMIAAQSGNTEYLSDFDYITYMDIDNDGKMEIIIDIPVAASFYRFGIYKYEDNAIKGEIDTFSSAA